MVRNGDRTDSGRADGRIDGTGVVASGDAGDTGPTDRANRAERVRLKLAAWWEANARDLPWRFGRATPWGVLVSEVMSQQTQMSRVVPYWTQWMERWPDARALAAAPKADVITAWGRLGYPRRALRLQECARVVSSECGDELPRAYDALVALPGVGDYTASAVMSFAYGERVAVIDTNIRRVLSRLFRGEESRGGAASPLERALANEVLPSDGGDSDDGPDDGPDDAVMKVPSCVSHDVPRGVPQGVSRHVPRATPPSVMWNQSVMELGALVCTAKNPLCEQCPVSDGCAFLAAGRPGLGERRTRPRQRFEGTDRQVRGIVLKALRELPAPHGLDAIDSLPRERVEALWRDHVQLDACIAGLDEDGLIEILPDGALRLPRG